MACVNEFKREKRVDTKSATIFKNKIITYYICNLCFANRAISLKNKHVFENV